jgi:hypothetical protein
MRRLSPDETQVIHSARIYGPLSFLYRRLLRKMLTTAMTTALGNLGALAEQRANAVDATELDKAQAHLHLV